MEHCGIERLAKIAIDCGFRVHAEIGPGLLEAAYEAFLAVHLADRGLRVETQKPVPIAYRGVVIRDAFRADLLVEGSLLIEVKSVERLSPVHTKQLLTYLRLLDQPLGLLMNFGADLFRNGLKRVINNRSDYVAPSIAISRVSNPPSD
ncbi:MAG: GxxExxY protein [Alphaproteobacteria bacterium]|nr:GxxExxY protein [Alphaproteobacteria bacterium]MBV9371948.1 GxxExxY protein [Alphaproteobacteria bacterium]MBV9900407.1 GxxExxY protein [Alphaproteobacteria bacterium]